MEIIIMAAVGFIIYIIIIRAVFSIGTILSNQSQQISNQQTLIEINTQVNQRLKIQNRLISEHLKKSGTTDITLREIFTSENYM